MVREKVQIVENILNANDQIAEENRVFFDNHGITALNIMASPGAGKTSVILKTIELLSHEIRMAVIEGDTAPVTIDADKISGVNTPVIQINSSGNCHLDALMIRNGLIQMDLQDINLIIIENIGNLICPAAFDLGAHSNVVIASLPEGDDKPYKYPNIYRGIDCLLLNKIDLEPYLDFDLAYFQKGIEALNPGVKIFPVSAKTGEGFDSWISWLQGRIKT